MIYRKILVGGAVAAAIVGAGGTALAVTSSDSPSPAPSGSSSSQHDTHADGKHKDGKHKDGKHKAGKHAKGLLRHVDHAQITRQKKDGAVTIDLIRGTVTASSSSSVTVQAADKKSETFAVTKDTKVVDRERGKKPADSSMGKIAKGDHVLVLGTGSTKFSAKRVAEFHPKAK